MKPKDKPKDFIVTKRPSLAAIGKHPHVAFDEYERRLRPMQTTMQAIQQSYLGTRERAAIVLEGWDTAGKGGSSVGWAGHSIPRLQGLPDRSTAGDEKGRHYLQRFWEKLPEHGQIVVFDRSWYGRVLVERVEGLASKPNGTAAIRKSISSNGC